MILRLSLVLLSSWNDESSVSLYQTSEIKILKCSLELHRRFLCLFSAHDKQSVFFAIHLNIFIINYVMAHISSPLMWQTYRECWAWRGAVSILFIQFFVLWSVQFPFRGNLAAVSSVSLFLSVITPPLQLCQMSVSRVQAVGYYWHSPLTWGTQTHKQRYTYTLTHLTATFLNPCGQMSRHIFEQEDGLLPDWCWQCNPLSNKHMHTHTQNTLVCLPSPAHPNHNLNSIHRPECPHSQSVSTPMV